MNDPRKLGELKFINRGDRDFDVEIGPLVVELSIREGGDWFFWNVRVGDQRFGGTQLLGPGEFTEWLDTMLST
jgi:hypothetical protein